MLPVLSPELLVAAYSRGFFPMTEEDGLISWFCPDPRTMIPLDAFHQPRRLARFIRKRPFEVVLDRDFEGVMRGCADRNKTWISDGFIQVYTALYRKGSAHSIEAYREGRLVGGIYGVSLGAAFMGESMFSREKGASSVCLVHLVRHLIKQGYRLFDVQFMTEHLRRFGAMEISRPQYLHRLKEALEQSCSWDG